MSGEMIASKTRLNQWHWGKILMLWIVVPAAGLGAGASAFVFMEEVDLGNDDLRVGLSLLLPTVSILAMLVITWLWLTGKESR